MDHAPSQTIVDLGYRCRGSGRHLGIPPRAGQEHDGEPATLAETAAGRRAGHWPSQRRTPSAVQPSQWPGRRYVERRPGRRRLQPPVAHAVTVTFFAQFRSGLTLGLPPEPLRDVLELLGSAPASARSGSTANLQSVATGNAQGQVITRRESRIFPGFSGRNLSCR